MRSEVSSHSASCSAVARAALTFLRAGLVARATGFHVRDGGVIQCLQCPTRITRVGLRVGREKFGGLFAATEGLQGGEADAQDRPGPWRAPELTLELVPFAQGLFVPPRPAARQAFRYRSATRRAETFDVDCPFGLTDVR